jgi:hypothetical protein
MSTKSATKIAKLNALAASTTFAGERSAALTQVARIRWADAIAARQAARLSAAYAPITWASLVNVAL